MGVIYKIENIVNGSFYVGSSVNYVNRKKTHLSKLKYNKHDNSHLQNSYNKHGLINFVFSILEECEDCVLEERELYYLQTLKPNYNKSIETINGNRGRKMSDEQRIKLSIAKGGTGILKPKKEKSNLPFSEVMRIATTNYYKNLTEEEKEKRNAHKKNRVFSEETRQKLSKKKKGIKHSKEHVQKRIDALKGKKYKKRK